MFYLGYSSNLALPLHNSVSGMSRSSANVRQLLFQVSRAKFFKIPYKKYPTALIQACRLTDPYVAS